MARPRCAPVTLLVALLSPASPGDAITGHVYGPAGPPSDPGVPGVDLDVFDQATGVRLNTPNDTTGVGGDFTVVVPPGLYRITFDPSGAPGPLLAPKQIFDVAVAGTADLDVLLGGVVLADGIQVTGQVVGPGGQGVSDADLDLIVPGTDPPVKMFTPGDNTDLLGFFSFVTEPGTYSVQVQPHVSARLLVGEFGPVAMSLPGPADLGTLPLAAGVFLSGTVLSAGGAPLAGVDVDVLFAGTQEEVPLVDDVTGSDGTYLTVVPTGTFDVTFTPATCSAFGAATVQDFAIAGDALLDATLSLPTSGGTPTPIALGNRFAGSFSACDDLDEISFEGVAGMLASIDARRSTGSARPGFVLIAPSSAILDLAPFTSIGATGTKATSVPLPETGTYHVVVLSANGSPGPYSVRTKGKAAAALKKVVATGAVAASGETVDVAFAALAGGTLKGKVLSGGSGLDPSVELVGPGDTPISLDGWTASRPGVSVSLLGVPLPATGGYTLRVGGANGTTGAFTAQLKVGYPKVPPTLVLEP